MSSENKNKNSRPYHQNGVFPIFDNGKLSAIYIYDDKYRIYYNVPNDKTSVEVFKDIRKIVGRGTVGNRYYLDQLKNILIDNEVRKENECYKEIKKDVAKTAEMSAKDNDWYHRV